MKVRAVPTPLVTLTARIVTRCTSASSNAVGVASVTVVPSIATSSRCAVAEAWVRSTLPVTLRGFALATDTGSHTNPENVLCITDTLALSVAKSKPADAPEAKWTLKAAELDQDSDYNHQATL